MWSETAMDAIEADEEWSSDDQAVDAAADAAEDAEAAADAAADAAEDASDPAFDRDNWSDADRQRVEELETARSEEHTSELQSLMRISYAVFCLKKKTLKKTYITSTHIRYKTHLPSPTDG